MASDISIIRSGEASADWSSSVGIYIIDIPRNYNPISKSQQTALFYMPISTSASLYICSRCLRASKQRRCSAPLLDVVSQKRTFVRSPPRASQDTAPQRKEPSTEGQKDADKDNAMARRLEQMNEEMLESGGRGALKTVEEAGFGEDLRKQLQDRIAGASFRSENAQALAQAQLPTSAGQGTRDVAGAKPWTGTETVEDAALRMLTDAHKPMKVKPKIPGVRGPPTKIDTGRPGKAASSTGSRLANARDRTSVYTMMKDSGLSPTEREQMVKEMKARFQPGARDVPATIQGLASLANERIEDAIARGQFKNLPRGKKIERDYNASSPFIDTTEYLMNKIIQKQEIVPPWIEKQQELVSAATKFRARLRSDWKRHAARMIASEGGSLDDQVKRAKEYAEAEARENPSRNKETINAVDSSGHLSQITLAGELKIPSDPRSTPVEEIKIFETTVSTEESQPPSAPPSVSSNPHGTSPAAAPPAIRGPFRDPAWEATEHSYHTLTITTLNAQTRSYNLIAPQIAQKPYYSLARELQRCFADVAPLLPSEIAERARRPKARVEVLPRVKTGGGILADLRGGEARRIYDEDLRKKGYGFRQLWRDLWRSRREEPV